MNNASMNRRTASDPKFGTKKKRHPYRISIHAHKQTTYKQQ